MEIDAQAVINELGARVGELTIENAQLKAFLSARMNEEGDKDGNTEDGSQP